MQNSFIAQGSLTVPDVEDTPLLRFASLGSGSRGNATLIEWNYFCEESGNQSSSTLLIDCGFGLKETEIRLARLGKHAADLTAILVTHEHSDHIKGVPALARRYQIPVYMTPGTQQSYPLGDLPQLHLIQAYAPFAINGLKVIPVAVPHDAREPAQYVVEFQGLRLGILTDLGSITPHVENAYQGCHAILIEANHDASMLASGSYPYSLKQRVGGQWGHLSNHQTAGFLQRLDKTFMQHLVIAHISQQNNSSEILSATLADAIAGIASVTYACQDEGFDWIHLMANQNLCE